jgi:hypothetical protein
MFKPRLTYANVAATLALFFSVSGGALAAKHYLINSTNQISPKVVKALAGKSGKTGAAGLTGREGPGGKEGPTGREGPVGQEVSAGKEGKEGRQGPSNGFQAFKNSVGLPTGPEATVGSLAVPAGSYVVSAKFWVSNTGTERVRVTCSLVNDQNEDKDVSEITADPVGTTSWYGRGMVLLQAASTMDSAGHWLVKCTDNGASGIDGEWLKIQALQVGSLSNTSA